ncbi:PDDEXK nuclease domain-containing protein [Flavobacterium sp. CFS9]|uniref:PDDEXK nuclease domain-containing protein n=1 Tax=Flavobacterium sp. CFS9 TaxID=3143118 RepID=A0AAT9H6B1_9FLAO
MNFEILSLRIQQTSDYLRTNAFKAVNMQVTLRNWLTGLYIVEFEQHGSDRAEYGVRLLENLAKRISVKGLTAPELSRCRQFYHRYPQFHALLEKDLKSLLPEAFFEDFSFENYSPAILGSATQELDGTFQEGRQTHLFGLFESVSYSHFTELIKIEDSSKRRFYEVLILKTQPTVKELKRQIDSLTYERIGLSQDHQHSFAQALKSIAPLESHDMVKSHYFFEFLNLVQPALIEENELESALIEHLQQFILELGNGFCYEARQKRLLIGDEYYFVDLVFYHRILKCHVLVELKTENAKHEHIGQLKAYLSFYRKNIRAASDNPPVGILLVTSQNKALVEYAIADSDLEIFVSQYQLQLPDRAELRAFIENELRKAK